MKDYLGDASDTKKREGGAYQNKRNNNKKQGGNFYAEKGVERQGLAKPVFTNTVRTANPEEAYGSIRNNNTEYTKKSNYASNNNERRQFFNSAKPGDSEAQNNNNTPIVNIARKTPV